MVLLLAACDWAQAGFDGSHGNFNPEHSGLNGSSVPNLVEAWSTVLDGTSPSPGPSVVVADGVVLASSSGEIEALDASSGSVVWRQTVASYASEPAVSNGLVFVNGSDLQMHAYHLRDGTPAWSQSVHDTLEVPPVVGDGIVYAIGQTGPSTADPAVLSALDAASGKLLWTAHQGNRVWPGYPPLVSDGVVVAFSSFTCADVCPGAVTAAYDAKTGAGKWSQGSDQFHALAAHGGVLYSAGGLSSNDNKSVVAYDISTGQSLWGTQSTGQPYVGFAIDGTFVYASNDGGVQAFSLSGCSQGPPCSSSWLALINGPASAPSASNGVVYVSGGGKLYALDATGGAQLLTNVFSVTEQPVVANGALYLTLANSVQKLTPR